jgi:hypothetical protein
MAKKPHILLAKKPLTGRKKYSSPVAQMITFREERNASNANFK